MNCRPRPVLTLGYMGGFTSITLYWLNKRFLPSTSTGHQDYFRGQPSSAIRLRARRRSQANSYRSRYDALGELVAFALELSTYTKAHLAIELQLSYQVQQDSGVFRLSQ